MKKFLFGILNWGLGHATRSIPVIQSLLDAKQEIIIASDGIALELLKKEFPELPFFELPPYQINYPAYGNMFWSLLRQTPRLLSTIGKTRSLIEEYALQNAVDVIISDNRYGCHSDYTYNIMLTHQVNIPIPKRHNWFSPFVRKQNHGYFKNFDEIWIPDYPGSLLSGEMSDVTTQKAPGVFIGPLSRLNNCDSANQDDFVLAILSGPEPQRTMFEQKLMNQSKWLDHQLILVRGNTKKLSEAVPENVTVIDLAKTEEINKLICSAKAIVCRSGYSSIMDLVKCKRSAFLVPTPGQTEQEQLAVRLREKQLFATCPQTLFYLPRAINELLQSEYDGSFTERFEAMNENSHLNLLQKQVNRVINI